MRFEQLLTFMASECRWCGRDVVLEEGHWVDPEATGDDSIWGETCDSNDAFTAEHEPILTERDFEWVICDRCHGEGTLGGYPGWYTQDDFDEDPDLREDYMNHRRTCEPDFSDDRGCHGTGKVRELTEAARNRPEIDEAIRDHYETEAIYAAERRMGA